MPLVLRDPRINPLPGDRLVDHNEFWTVRSVDAGFVSYHPSMSIVARTISLEQWRYETKNASIIRINTTADYQVALLAASKTLWLEVQKYSHGYDVSMLEALADMREAIRQVDPSWSGK